MTLDKIESILKSPEYKKYDRYLDSFYCLTEDEKKRVLKRHKGFNTFYALKRRYMVLIAEALSEALSVGLESGQALQVEDLDVVLKRVTYTDEHLKFWKNLA